MVLILIFLKIFFLIDKTYDKTFDIIIGNPPYNYGTIKTPTNAILDKKIDGKSIWQNFIIRSLELLKDNGFLSLIVPSIWLKPDKKGIYKLLTQYKILKLRCFSNSETNKLFNYQAQTPTCFFLIQKTLTNNNDILIYDQIYNMYISYNLLHNYPIPLSNISIINKFLYFVKKYGNIKIYKTNSPSIKCDFSTNYSIYYPYKNVCTCILEGSDRLIPELLENYSNIPNYGHTIPKLILAHKMYGFPFFDYEGCLGIASRDNYIIKDYSLSQLKNIQKFLSTKTILFLYNATTYRMKYLERYIFQFIPDISKISFFNNLSNNVYERDCLISKFFNLSDIEFDFIQNNVKNYKFFC